MSFNLKISSKDKATGRFKSRVNRALMKAVIEAKRDKNLTQSQIAKQMGVDKSVLSRILNGQGNLTLKTIGDICWVLGLRPDIAFSRIQREGSSRANHPAVHEDTKKRHAGSPDANRTNIKILVYPQGAARPQTGSSRSERVIIANGG